MFYCEFGDIFQPATLLKTGKWHQWLQLPQIWDSGTDIFLWMLRNISASNFIKHFEYFCRFQLYEIWESGTDVFLWILRHFSVCTFIKMRTQHRSFPVSFSKSLRTPTLETICERLLLMYDYCLDSFITFFVLYNRKNIKHNCSSKMPLYYFL